jgi:hypothetical protein
MPTEHTKGDNTNNNVSISVITGLWNMGLTLNVTWQSVYQSEVLDTLFVDVNDTVKR